MPEVFSNLKQNCPCDNPGCGASGAIDPKTGHSRGCVETCAVCARPRSATKRPDIPRQTRRQVMARAQGLCEVVGRDDVCCSRRAEHLHHIRRRSQGGRDQVSNLLAVCQTHHREIHDNPEWAVSMGYLKRTEADPNPPSDLAVQELLGEVPDPT